VAAQLSAPQDGFSSVSRYVSKSVYGSVYYSFVHYYDRCLMFYAYYYCYLAM
jgi:hypothetical protein